MLMTCVQVKTAEQLCAKVAHVDPLGGVMSCHKNMVMRGQ